MEKRNLEECRAIKFCFKLKESAIETYEKLKRAYGEMLYRGQGFLGGINNFCMAVRVWKTNLVLEELARQKGRKYDQREGSREA
jgi:hypothetical protein